MVPCYDIAGEGDVHSIKDWRDHHTLDELKEMVKIRADLEENLSSAIAASTYLKASGEKVDEISGT